MNDIDKRLKRRAEMLIEHHLPKEVMPSAYYMAGGCFRKERINDIDIYPVGHPLGFDVRTTLVGVNSVLTYKSKNVHTYAIDGMLVQCCRYYKQTLEELVESFDFNLCQVGVTVVDGQVTDIYHSKAYELFDEFGKVFYTGSEFPLGSLLRHGKYSEYQSKREYRDDQVHILSDICKRGYTSYTDFLSQLDSIDLGYRPENRKQLQNIFHALQKKGDANG